MKKTGGYFLCTLMLLVGVVPLCWPAASVVTDPVTKAAVLAAAFPGMEVELVPGKRIDLSVVPPQDHGSIIELVLPWKDAFAVEDVYHVTGAFASEIEMCASEDMGAEDDVKDRFSRVRELRLKLFHYREGTGTPARLIAVMQYKFLGAHPAGSCWSIGRVASLVLKGGRWNVQTSFEVDSQHHSGFQGIRILDLGDGKEQLVFESNWGGAGVAGATLFAYDISGGNFRLRFSEVSETSDSAETVTFYTQTLDVPATRRRRGRLYCFTRTTLVEEDHWYWPRQVTHPCFSPLWQPQAAPIAFHVSAGGGSRSAAWSYQQPR